MKTFIRLGIVTALLNVCSFFAFSQGNTTNKGTEFWTAYMDHINGASGANSSKMVLYITSDVNTTGTVSVADGSFTQSFTVTANNVTTITIPANAFLNSEGQFLKGIHIVSALPIVVYAHIYAQNVSGATLVLPVTALAKDYYSINYTQQSNQANCHSAFIVIATEDNTTVEITPSAALLSGKAANQTFTVTLNKGELYQALSNTDLTGSRIKSVSNASGGCKRIAVYSGSSKLYIGCPGISSDNLFQQVYPTASWGKNFITAPLSNRNYDTYRIVLSDPSAKVTLNGSLVPASSFTGGFYYEFNSSTPNIISADKPIQVVQYAVTQGNTETCVINKSDVGDPEMIYLIPLEQGLNQVTLYSTPFYKIINSYINVILPTTAVSSFTLDGTKYNAFTPIPGNPAYSYAQIGVGNSTHNISASDNFNAIAYGFGNAESYGYAAGTNLKNLNENIVLQNPKTDSTYTTGCTNANYDLQLTLPYITSSITWDFKDGSAPVTQSNPQYTVVQRGTQTLYLYHYGKQTTFTNGQHTVVATVFNPVADECGSSEDVNFYFVVNDPPSTDFTIDGDCLGSPTVFTDKTNLTGDRIKTWNWKFGDTYATGGIDTSTTQNPSYTYSRTGTYTVSLTTTTFGGCLNIQTHTVSIHQKPVADFSWSAVNCEGVPVTFTDKSTPGEGTLESWTWIFSDAYASANNKDTVISQNPIHVFTHPGKYVVKMVTTNSNGCPSDTVHYTLTINPVAHVDFAVPNTCIDDNKIQFTNKSTISDGSNLSYYWDFGDAQVNAVSAAQRTLANPTPQYVNPGYYNVKLTVTSKYQCSHDTTILFTLNGANPHADFKVENAGNLCSNNPVIIDNLSNVGPTNIGHINEIDLYYDYDNDPVTKDVFYYDQGQIKSQYSHTYPVFSVPQSKNYHIKMVVYTGQTQSCVASYDQTITVNANPIVTVADIPPICHNASPWPLIVDQGNYTGTGTFSGAGVVYQGTVPYFDPSKASLGTNTINYEFDNSGTGCSYTTTKQVLVYPAPVVSAGPGITILEGGNAPINATVSGDNLTYKWTIGTLPAVGLSQDNILNPVASPVEDTQYTLTATSPEGCSTSSTVYVTVLKLPVIPNTFTPNGDGINDTWNIQYLNTYPNCSVDVYNRLGEKVYSSIGYSIPWDGRFKGADLPVGTYYYIINPKLGRKVMTGSITIIR